MTIYWPTILICLTPLFACYATIPWFRAAVDRRLMFKPFDYDALTDIYANGMPERMRIECLQAKYTAFQANHSHVDIFPHKENVAALRFRVDEEFPIARIFHGVLVGNYNALGLKTKKAPTISINQSVYRVLDFEYDDQYLFIYVKHH